ncbi:MAG: hypothetical protein IIX14_05530 [Clostridia bacterium]|nr:hypothetical protein [Clostridia bacterium]
MELGSVFSEKDYEKGFEFANSNGYTIKEVNSKQENVEKEIEYVDEKGNLSIKYEMVVETVRYFQIVEIPQPTEEEFAQQKIADLKSKLASTDYVVIKIAEGEATAEEYSEILAQRKAWRAEINQLEALGV